MRKVFVVMAFAAWILAPASDAQEKPSPFDLIEDDPNLPRVLLIGDSISVGYTLPVREILQGFANVHRIPTNGGPTIRGWDRLDEWLGEKKWDVIHFNWGLHDLKILEDGKHQVPLDYYRLTLERLVKRLKATGAQLIWASTTPVPEGDVSPKRIPADVVRYNEAAAEIMKRYDAAVNDLYSFARPRLEKIQRPVNVHFTDEGSQALAQQTAEAIRASLGKIKK